MPPRVPLKSEFPAETRFVIKEFDVPLLQFTQGGELICVNWFGGVPRPYDVKWLKVDNNWMANSFEEWVQLVVESLPK